MVKVRWVGPFQARIAQPAELTDLHVLLDGDGHLHVSQQHAFERTVEMVVIHRETVEWLASVADQIKANGEAG